MPKLDLASIEQTNRTSYPMPFAAEMTGRHYRRLGPAGGLTQLGVSHCILDPGGVSSQRHWHEGIDEFVVVLEGEAMLVEDGGETLLRAGDCAAFPKDVPNVAGPSSSPVMIRLCVPRCRVSEAAARKAAIPPFMSTAPRP